MFTFKRNNSLNIRLGIMVIIKNCEVCGHDKFKDIGTKIFKDIQIKSGLINFQVHLVCCQCCGVIFQNPLQDEKKLSEYYQNMFREEKIRPAEIIQKTFDTRIKFLLKFKTKNMNSLLEVGCADGTTLMGFRKQGFKVTGIDPSKENIKICKNRKIESYNVMYEKLNLPKKFDFICSYYVLEHLRSPQKFLKFCNSFLRDNGIICIEIPAIEFYKNQKTTHNLLFFHEHQYQFTKETIEILLKKCGFKLLEFEESTYDFGMHFSAQKISIPKTNIDFSISEQVFTNVINEVNNYKKVFSDKFEILEEKLRKIKNLPNKSKIGLCPAGLGTRMLLEILKSDKKNVRQILDNNSDKHGMTMYGIEIYPVEKVDTSLDRIIIMSSFSEELKTQLISLGVNEEKISIF